MMTMKCPNCGAEVHEEDKFCGECRENLRREIEIAPKWKWGSMIASLLLVFIFWFLIFAETSWIYGGMDKKIFLTLIIFGFPTTIYLMYKERAGKIKYGLAWILFPILILLVVLDVADAYEREFALWMFLWFAIPAIVIDVIYVYKTRALSRI